LQTKIYILSAQKTNTHNVTYQTSENSDHDHRGTTARHMERQNDYCFTIVLVQTLRLAITLINVVVLVSD